MVEEDENLNKVRIAKKKRKKEKKKDAKDVVHKELYKIYYKTPLLYILQIFIDIIFGFFFLH